MARIILPSVIGLTLLYAVAWIGMYLLDKPDIFWIVGG